MNILKQNYEYLKLEYDKEITVGEYSCLHYYSKSAMKKVYPDGTYNIVGAIGSGLKQKSGEYMYEGELQNYYTMYFSKLRCKVIGYVKIGEHEYLAVVKKNYIPMVLLLLLALCFITFIICSYIWLSNEAKKLDPNASDYAPSTKLDLETDPNNIAIPGYKDIKIKAGTDTAYVALWNPTNNPCLFKFTIKLTEGDKILYESGLVAPGKAITEVKLNQIIPAGEHEISIDVETFALDDAEKRLNGGVVETVLIAFE